MGFFQIISNFFGITPKDQRGIQQSTDTSKSVDEVDVQIQELDKTIKQLKSRKKYSRTDNVNWDSISQVPKEEPQTLSIFQRYSFGAIITLAFLKQERIRKEKERIEKLTLDTANAISQAHAFVRQKDLNKASELAAQIRKNMGEVQDANVKTKYKTFLSDLNKLREEVINSNSAISGKKSAGILDTAMYSYFKMAEQSGVLSANETRALQMIRVAAQEGTTLTSKSETAGADPDKIQKVQEAMNKLMRYTTGSSGEKWEEEKSEIRATLQDALSERKGKELSELSDEFTTYKDGEKVGDMDKIMDFMMSLPERIRGNGSTRNSLKTFDSQSGSAIDKMAEVSSYEGSLIGNAAEGVNEISQNLGLGKAVRVIEPPRPSAPHNAAGTSPDSNSTTRDIAEQTMRDSKAFDRLARNSRQLASKGGLGAIGAGIAVGIMGLGYLSGNHSPAPAATMANDAAAYESQQNQNGEAYSAAAMPSLSDTNLNVQRGGPNQGYVININAQTSGG